MEKVLFNVRVLRDGAWQTCRLGEVKIGESFEMWHDGKLVRKAIAIQHGRFDDEVGGRIAADVQPNV